MTSVGGLPSPTVSIGKRRVGTPNPSRVPTRVTALLYVLFFSGFINLIPLGNLYPATILTDAIVASMFISVSLSAIRNPGRAAIEGWMLAFGLLAVTYIVLMTEGTESLGNKLLIVRSHVLYAFVAIFVVLRMTTRESVDKLLQQYLRIATASAAFGIFQYAFRAQLPTWLLVSRDTKLFGYYGTDISRSTGLVGNTIVYSSMLLLAYSVLFGRLIEHFSLPRLAQLAITAAAIITTYSRVAILGLVVVTLVFMLLRIVRAKSIRGAVTSLYILLVALTVGFALFASPHIADRIRSSFIYSGLFLGQNASVQTSTAGHFSFITTAIATTHSHLLLGVGLATQQQNSRFSAFQSSITDGALLATFVEGGLLLALVYGVFIGSALWRLAFRDREFGHAEVRTGFLIFSVYQFGFACLFNSAYFGKGPFVLYWMIFGALVASARSNSGAGEILPPRKLAKSRRPHPTATT